VVIPQTANVGVASSKLSTVNWTPRSLRVLRTMLSSGCAMRTLSVSSSSSDSGSIPLHRELRRDQPENPRSETAFCDVTQSLCGHTDRHSLACMHALQSIQSRSENQAGLFCDRYELRWRNRTIVGCNSELVLQCGNGPSLEIDFGLIVQRQFIPFQCEL